MAKSSRRRIEKKSPRVLKLLPELHSNSPTKIVSDSASVIISKASSENLAEAEPACQIIAAWFQQGINCRAPVRILNDLVVNDSFMGYIFSPWHVDVARKTAGPECDRKRCALTPILLMLSYCEKWNLQPLISSNMMNCIFLSIDQLLILLISDSNQPKITNLIEKSVALIWSLCKLNSSVLAAVNSCLDVDGMKLLNREPLTVKLQTFLSERLGHNIPWGLRFLVVEFLSETCAPSASYTAELDRLEVDLADDLSNRSLEIMRYATALLEYVNDNIPEVARSKLVEATVKALYDGRLLFYLAQYVEKPLTAHESVGEKGAWNSKDSEYADHVLYLTKEAQYTAEVLCHISISIQSKFTLAPILKYCLVKIVMSVDQIMSTLDDEEMISSYTRVLDLILQPFESLYEDSQEIQVLHTGQFSERELLLALKNSLVRQTQGLMVPGIFSQAWLLLSKQIVADESLNDLYSDCLTPIREFLASISSKPFKEIPLEVLELARALIIFCSIVGRLGTDQHKKDYVLILRDLLYAACQDEENFGLRSLGPVLLAYVAEGIIENFTDSKYDYLAKELNIMPIAARAAYLAQNHNLNIVVSSLTHHKMEDVSELYTNSFLSLGQWS